MEIIEPLANTSTYSQSFQRNKSSSLSHLLNKKENQISNFSVHWKIGETKGLIIFYSGAQLSLVDRKVGKSTSKILVLKCME